MYMYLQCKPLAYVATSIRHHLFRRLEMPSGPVALPKRLIVVVAYHKTRYKHSCTSLFIECLLFSETSRIFAVYIHTMTIACPFVTYVAQSAHRGYT